MNMKWLKWVAIITMTIDHIGYLLIPSGTATYMLCRAIGRIAFPMFAMMIAEGFRHTHNLKKYLLGMALLAGITEIAFLIVYLLDGPNLMLTTNAFLPLLWGLIALILLNQKKWYFKILVLPMAAFAYFADISYGIYGFLTIMIFGIIPSRKIQLIAFVLLNFVIIQWPFWTALGVSFAPGRIYFHWLQWFSILAFVPLSLYNGQRGKYNKWFFYAYYPAHFLILFLISKYLI